MHYRNMYDSSCSGWGEISKTKLICKPYSEVAVERVNSLHDGSAQFA